jgi:hypothetical protein
MVTNVLQEKKGGFSLAKYHVIAYADEDGYPRREATIEARNKDEAWDKAWRMFPEYHEVGVFEAK